VAPWHTRVPTSIFLTQEVQGIDEGITIRERERRTGESQSCWLWPCGRESRTRGCAGGVVAYGLRRYVRAGAGGGEVGSGS
jgi:hypothetical protein